MTQEFKPFGKADVTWSKKRLNTDVLTCHKCGVQLKEGDSVHRQRLNFYCASCWRKAYLDAED